MGNERDLVWKGVRSMTQAGLVDTEDPADGSSRQAGRLGPQHLAGGSAQGAPGCLWAWS